MGGGGGCPGGAGRAASRLAVLQSHQQLTALISGRLDATTSESSCRAFFTATSAPPLASSGSSKGRLCAPPSAMARRRCCCRSRPAAARDGRFLRRPWVMADVEKEHNTIFRSVGCGRAVVMRAAASGAAARLPVTVRPASINCTPRLLQIDPHLTSSVLYQSVYKVWVGSQLGAEQQGPQSSVGRVESRACTASKPVGDRVRKQCNGLGGGVIPQHVQELPPPLIGG